MSHRALVLAFSFIVAFSVALVLFFVGQRRRPALKMPASGEIGILVGGIGVGLFIAQIFEILFEQEAQTYIGLLISVALLSAMIMITHSSKQSNRKKSAKR
jgi:predicted lipid-binding transport protein (Tim44 family)